MEFTGERFIPGISGPMEAEHYHRYFFAASLAAGKDVLDVASGEGYGSSILAQAARSVVGVDIAREAVAHASAAYGRPNLAFMLGSADKIPLGDASADVAVSFETLEHVPFQEEMIAEIKRVLRKTGVLLISTPNKSVYDSEGGHSNAFHVKELELGQFMALLRQHFANAVLFGQRVMYGSFIGACGQPAVSMSEEPGIIPWRGASSSLPLSECARYYIAAASDGPLDLPLPRATFYDYPAGLCDEALNLRRELDESQENESDLRKEIEAMRKSLADSEKRNAETRLLYEQIIASRSWRLTAPLRRLFGLCRNMAGHFKANGGHGQET